VHMDNHEAERVFSAGMHLVRVPITGSSLARALLRWPAMTLRVIAGIYWQALRLKLKGVRFFTHPGTARCGDEA